MNSWLWAGQIFLAVMFIGTGGWKLAVPKDRLRTPMPWVDDLSQRAVHAVAAIEVVGGIGAVLPWLTGILPVLTPLAAAGLALVMTGGLATHLRRHEYARSLSNVVLLAVSVLVAAGRFA
ncbi:DoxX family protein [Streptomyces sp. NBC_00237]|uniref:DoxX family protein n=1 Tax=Streptomyces sp. NBC_00237 TaxID=2975687 RepID=UPI00224D2313|nr:DoxX family protein [Streptomyces sp. NBC_00237]MCX5205681.1 DoxX family protein [Streptomyces sp. NBC_00237]